METVRRDRSRALNTPRIIVVLLGLLLAGKQVPAQEVDKDGLYSQPFLVLDPEMHTADIRGVAADAAGRYIVTSSYDKTVRVWSGGDGRLLRTIRLPSGPDSVGQAFAVAISPDGNTIATSAKKQYILLFERATGRQVGRIGPLPDTQVNKLAFSHDGSRIAASVGRGVGLYDVDGGKKIAFDDQYGGQIYGISFDRTGRIATYATRLRGAPHHDYRLKLPSRPTISA